LLLGSGQLLEPFEIAVTDTILWDLALRLRAARLPPSAANDWDAGMSPVYLRELITYWRDRFDWRSQEALLNRFQHYRGEVGFGDLWQKLMTEELGYSRFGAHGGDWGSTITEHLARSHAASVVGIHLTDVPFWHIFQKPSDLTQNEQKFLERNKRWQKEDGAYAMLSLQTLASLATYRCSVIWSPDSVPKLASN
jgi:hypothetical protein